MVSCVGVGHRLTPICSNHSLGYITSYISVANQNQQITISHMWVCTAAQITATTSAQQTRNSILLDNLSTAVCYSSCYDKLHKSQQSKAAKSNIQQCNTYVNCEEC